MVRLTDRPGYTLIEMLVSIAIFSGLLIIVLGTIATSSSSSATVSVLRDKNQAARAMIDQISNDWRYVDKTAIFQDVSAPGHTCQSYNGNCLYAGYSIDTNRLVLALNLSGSTPATEWTRKEYKIGLVGSRQTLTVIEGRHCQIASYNWSCSQNSPQTDLLSTTYVLDSSGQSWPSQFGGQTVPDGAAAIPPITPFLSLAFTIKPTSDQSILCSDVRTDSGTCYKVTTTLSLGSTS